MKLMQPIDSLSGLTTRAWGHHNLTARIILRDQSQQNSVICSDMLSVLSNKNLNANKAIVRWELMVDVSDVVTLGCSYMLC